MELMLWRWSTAVQVASCLMVTLFFVVFATRARSAEVLAWRRAWLMNAVALLVTVAFWMSEPTGAPPRLVSAVYLSAKLAFLASLAGGIWMVARPAASFPGGRRSAYFIAAYSVVGALLSTSLPALGVVGSIAIAGFLLPMGVWSARQGIPGFRWLGLGLLVRGAVAAAEGVAYATQLSVFTILSDQLRDAASLFMAASSSFDSGAEWLLALGCVLVTMQRQRHEVELVNRDLLAAQENLRSLADLDPLTGLLNRRVMGEVLRQAQTTGGSIAFIDLDDFKRVNDLHGHEAGDALLRIFAQALRDSFRPGDAVVRYAGDEFVVVARELDAVALGERIAVLRETARDIPFSFGVSELNAGMNPDVALRSADARMYAAKALTQGAQAA